MKTLESAQLALTFTADAWESFKEILGEMRKSHAYYVIAVAGDKKVGGLVHKVDDEGFYLEQFDPSGTEEVDSEWPYPPEVEVVRLSWEELTEVHIP